MRNILKVYFLKIFSKEAAYVIRDKSDGTDAGGRRTIVNPDGEGGEIVKEFLRFRKMITPVIIQIVFWIGVVGSILAGVALLFQGGGLGLQSLVNGVLMIILGPIAVRVYCELLILLFRINENLIAVRKKLDESS